MPKTIKKKIEPVILLMSMPFFLLGIVIIIWGLPYSHQNDFLFGFIGIIFLGFGGTIFGSFGIKETEYYYN